MFLPSVIPGGCRGLLQPADVSWNKPFKAHLRREYDNWMENACIAKNTSPAHEALPVVLEGWTITHDERPELQDSEEEDELDTAEGLTLCDQNDK